MCIKNISQTSIFQNEWVESVARCIILDIFPDPYNYFCRDDLEKKDKKENQEVQELTFFKQWRLVFKLKNWFFSNRYEYLWFGEFFYMLINFFSNLFLFMQPGRVRIVCFVLLWFCWECYRIKQRFYVIWYSFSASDLDNNFSTFLDKIYSQENKITWSCKWISVIYFWVISFFIFIIYVLIFHDVTKNGTWNLIFNDL